MLPLRIPTCTFPARWTSLQSDPQVDLVMSLERSRLEDVVAVVRRLWPNCRSLELEGPG